MRGTKTYVSGAWRFQVYNAATRRRVTRTFAGPNNRIGVRDADAALRRLIDEVEAGRHDVDDDNITVGQHLERWLRVYRSRWAHGTYVKNRNAVRHLELHLGHIELTSLRKHHIQDCYAELESTLGPATIQGVHGVLRNALNDAVPDVIAVNPCNSVKHVKVERRPDTKPEPEQLLRLLDAADSEPDLSAYIRLSASSGARRGTVSALRWSTVDFDRGMVTFLTKLSRTEDGFTEKPGNKVGKRYPVMIGLDLNAALRRWRLEQRERALALGVVLPPDGWVFTSWTDPRKPTSPTTWDARWRRLTRSVDPSGGLDRIRLHDLRHYAATQLLAGGMPVLMVSERLSLSPALLLNLYGHSVPAGDQEAADLMDRLMRPGG